MYMFDMIFPNVEISRPRTRPQFSLEMVSSRLVNSPDREKDLSIPDITYQSSRAINLILDALEEDAIQRNNTDFIYVSRKTGNWK